jgi:hypothetical protein
MVLENGPPRQVLLPVELMLRASTGKPRNARAAPKRRPAKPSRR